MAVSEHWSKVGWYIIVYKFVPEFHALHVKDILNFEQLQAYKLRIRLCIVFTIGHNPDCSFL